MSRNRIWLNSREFVEFPKSRTSLTEELATRKRSIDFYGLGTYLPNPDPVLKKAGKSEAVYDELLSDGHLGGCVSSRKAGVRSLEWEIDRGKAKSRPARVIEDLFNRLDLDRIIAEILDAPLFGYQPIEVLWEKRDGLLLPRDVLAKPRRWFVFAEDGELRLRTRDNYVTGEEVPPRKFLLARHGATYENPYGVAELSRCFWPVTFKRGGFKFWVVFAEKYGMPWLIGKVPRGQDPKETTKLLDQLEAMVQDAIAVIPDDSSVEPQVIGGKASSDIYRDLIEECKAEISIAMLGQNLTTEVQGGSYAAAQSHMEVRKDIVDSDRRLVERVLNEMIGWIFELNWDGGERPAFSMYEEEDVDKAQAERDEILSRTGVRFTADYYRRTYGFEEGDIEVGSPSPGPSPEGRGAEFADVAPSPSRGEGRGEGGRCPHCFAEGEGAKDSADVITDRLLAEASGEALTATVAKLLGEVETLEEFRDRLLALYGDMDVTALGNTIQRALVVAELSGRFDASQR